MLTLILDIGEHITAKIREEFLQSCLRQNIAFFDKLGAGEVTTRITADTNLIQEGISEKMSLTLTAVATFLSAFVIGRQILPIMPLRAPQHTAWGILTCLCI